MSRSPAIRFTGAALLSYVIAAWSPSHVLAQNTPASVERLESLLEEQRTTIERDRKALNMDCGIVSSNDTVKLEECRARREDVSRRMRKYDADLDAFLERKAVLEGIESELATIGKRIVTSRREIERYADQTRLKDYQTSLEEWAQLPGPAREKARHAAVDGLMTLTIELGSLATEKKMELTRESIEKLSGMDYQKFLSALERQASLALRRDLALDYDSLRNRDMLLKALSTLKDGMVGLHSLELRDRDEYLALSLKFIAIVNSTLIKNPGIALLVLDAEVVPAAAYGWLAGHFAQERVNQLVEVGEAQLKGLAAVSTLYAKDITRRNKLLDQRNSILGEAEGN